MPTGKIGHYFLQGPGPTVVPERVMTAMAMPMLDHRSQNFANMASEASANLKKIFKTKQEVMIFPSSGSGAWQAAITNLLSPGDKVLIHEVGQFSYLWTQMAKKLGLDVIEIEGDWRTGIDASKIKDVLANDKDGLIKAVFATHNETATGVTSDLPAVRKAIDEAGHDCLLFADTVSSLCASEYDHDGWGIDVAICGSQKGLMLPPGLGFVVASDKALAHMETSKFSAGYFAFEPMLEAAKTGFYPYTPPVSLFFGLLEVTKMILENGVDNIVANHNRLARATRACVAHWGLENQSINEHEHSNAVTAVRLPDGFNADEFRALVFDKFDMSMAAGLGKVKGKVFRIGHLGYQNDLSVCGALSGVEMGLKLFGVPHTAGGVNAAMDVLASEAAS